MINDIMILIFIGFPSIYSYKCLSNLFKKNNISRKEIIKFKKFKGIMYIILSLFSLFNFKELSDWLTISIAICEGCTCLFESSVENIDLNNEDMLSKSKNDNLLKIKENLLTEIRVVISCIERHLKNSNIYEARKNYFEIEEMIRVYKCADDLNKELNAAVFVEEDMNEERYDKIMELYNELEDELIYNT